MSVEEEVLKRLDRRVKIAQAIWCLIKCICAHVVEGSFAPRSLHSISIIPIFWQSYGHYCNIITANVVEWFVRSKRENSLPKKAIIYLIPVQLIIYINYRYNKKYWRISVRSFVGRLSISLCDSLFAPKRSLIQSESIAIHLNLHICLKFTLSVDSFVRLHAYLLKFQLPLIFSCLQ